MPALTPRNVAIGAAAVVAASFAFPRTVGKVAPENVFETHGVRNVADRYAAQGGTTTHLPGVATPLGNSDSVASNQEKMKGLGTKTFSDEKSEQKVHTGSKFLEAHTGDAKGK